MTGNSSNKILEKKEAILSLWEKRCLSEVPSAETGASLSLRNSLPLYLEHLSEALATNKRMDFKSIFKREEEATRIGKMHGADRANNKSYQLTEVIFEYHILREVIFQVLESETQLAAAQRDIIFDSIEQAVNDAAVEFSDIHADIQQKFVNTLTHDLKNPLTVAKISAQLIQKRPENSEICLNLATKIVSSVNRLESMIHDLLDASRIRAGEPLALQFLECDLNQVVHEVVSEMKSIHGDRFILNSKEAVQGSWACDGLRRVVENLIGNAVKYGAVDTPITVSLARENSNVIITVHNEGNPIPENEIASLFMQHRRSKSAEAGVSPGWGLGLTLVKGVVLAHKGKVRVESSPERGTSFILEIPAESI